MNIRQWYRGGQEAGDIGIAPDQIGNVEVWYDASDAAYQNLTGNFVDSWLDRSGNARHTSYQLLGTLKNEVVTSSGRRAIKMNDSISWSSAFTLANFPITMYCVVNVTVENELSGFCSYNREGNIRQYYSIIGKIGDLAYYEQRNGGAQFGGATPDVSIPNATPFVLEGLSVGNTDYRISVDNGAYQIGTNSVSWNTLMNRFSIGAMRSSAQTNSAAPETEFLELVMFSKQLTTEERTGLNQYFKNKHGF